MNGIDREQMLALAGIEYNFNEAYTPVTVGKKNRITTPTNIWGDQFRNLNFTNVEELKAITPENVSAKMCYFQKEDGNFAPIDNKFAIVGDNTQEVYAVHSDKYAPIQHSVIVEAMADALHDTSLNVFGHFDESKGRFNGYGTFANPDVHINLGFDQAHDDPVMLGMRFFNSHNGDSRFGGEIYGIRAVCQNYMAWGEILGNVSIMHFKSEENVAEELGKVLRGFVDNVDALKDRVHYIRETPLDKAEQESVLWGIGLNAGQIENILTHQKELNPEIGEKGSMWDLYNASTAYVTYHVGGAHTVKMNLNLSDKIQQMLVQKTDDIITRGEKAKSKYQEQLNTTAQRMKIKVVA